jgi:hypothetical protein
VLLGVFLVQSVLRTIVCANFTGHALGVSSQGSERVVNTFKIVYYTITWAIILVLAYFSIFSEKYAVSCSSDFFSYQWFVLDILDLVQSVLITLSAAYLARHLQGLIREQYRA